MVPMVLTFGSLSGKRWKSYMAWQGGGRAAMVLFFPLILLFHLYKAEGF
jgi:hypothetical protein